MQRPAVWRASPHGPLLSQCSLEERVASLPEEVLGSAELSETVTPPAEASPRRLREA